MPLLSLRPHHNPAEFWVTFTEWTFGNVSNLFEIPQPVTGRSAFDSNTSACELSTMALPARHKCDGATVQKPASWRLSHQYRHHHGELLELKCTTCSEYRVKTFIFTERMVIKYLPESKWKVSFGAPLKHFLVNAKITRVAKSCCNHTLLKGWA